MNNPIVFPDTRIPFVEKSTVANANEIILAIPKGRVSHQITDLLHKVGIIPESTFADGDSRQLKFGTNIETVSIIRVRSFDVATFVAFGVAHLGICGNDVLEEFHYADIYTPVNLKVGACRLVLAKRKTVALDDDIMVNSHLRIATKYPYLTKKYFRKRNIGAEIIKLNGSIELAPNLGLSQCIVDLVSSGKTLRANNLEEVETFLDVTSYLLVNRTAFKTRADTITGWIKAFRDAVNNE